MIRGSVLIVTLAILFLSSALLATSLAMSPHNPSLRHSNGQLGPIDRVTTQLAMANMTDKNP